MLLNMQDERFEREAVQESEQSGEFTCHFSISYGEYDKNLGDHPIVGFSVRSYKTENPDEDGICATFDSFLEARAFFDYAKVRTLKSH